MNEILHANVFFIIASVGTVIFVFIVSAILWQVYRLVRTIRSIVDRVDAASGIIAQDVLEFRQAVRHGLVGHLMRWFTGSRRGKDDSND